ncbi:MAG: hypothetical protein HC915_03110, partial [Anaerolineae bacterium]|nr:hypothetical protein [Anaerolineae bacterium]
MEPTPLLERAKWIILLGALVALLGVLGVYLADAPEPVEIAILPPAPTATLAPIEVYITGAVAQPESVVSLAPDARVRDALQAAGGALPDADLSRLNLAAPLQDGAQVHVPRQGEAALGVPDGLGNAALPINLNTATLEELDTLPGVGPSLAAAILAYRAENGPFQTLEALLEVPGIGEATLARLRPLAIIEASAPEPSLLPPTLFSATRTTPPHRNRPTAQPAR